MLSLMMKGDFSKTNNYFKKLLNLNVLRKLEKYGKEGVAALSANTPVDTGRTADSWSYRIEESSTGASVIWTNSNVNNGVNIALILQYGHGTGTGGYVEGRDYINPSLRPLFDKFAKEFREEVKP